MRLSLSIWMLNNELLSIKTFDNFWVEGNHKGKQAMQTEIHTYNKTMH